MRATVTALAVCTAMMTMMASCRAGREAVREEMRSVHDTVRIAARQLDSVATQDTVRLVVRAQGDTVTVWRDAVRWRTRVTERRDTVWASRRDTLWRTKEATHYVERPRKTGDWAWPMAVGALGGSTVALWLTRRSKS